MEASSVIAGGKGRRHLCYVVSSPMTIEAFLVPHIRASLGLYDVTLVANGPFPDSLRTACAGASFEAIGIERRVAPLRDALAMWKLYRLFCRGRFDIVHSVSPKAGLLAMLAARAARVPRRLHTFTGQVWVTRHGWRRALLKQVDRLLATLATDPLVDSPSQRDFLVKEGILTEGNSNVIGKGSICGVDPERFMPDFARRSLIRRHLGVPESAFMILFIGRINRDKGVLDLATAFAGLAGIYDDTWLIFAGPDEGGLADSINVLADSDRCRCIGATNSPEILMAAADVVCLPSYREGFGMVLLEAAASNVPAVASRIYGITDAVAEGKTGLLHEPGDVAGIATAIARLHDDPGLRRAMGEAARTRAISEFSESSVTKGLLALYGKILLRQPDGTKS